MLLELRVENLLLIERAELALAPGLNVLTGETGAGKTVLAHALDLLLGGRARAGIVRPGADEAYVEGVFELPDPLPPELADRLAGDAGELVLARRVGAEGRTRALLNGRTIGVADLRDIAGGLISFYGQHEHRRLTLASAQLEILDGFCGPDQQRRRTECAAAHTQVRELEAELAELRERAGSRERELDLLAFELEEIEAARPDAAEHAALLGERERLRHMESLRSAAWTAAAALDGAEGDGDGAASRLATGVGALEAVAGVDGGLDLLTERQRALSIEAADLASELARYVDGLEDEPGRLEAVEARLTELDRLIRKHGGTVEAVLAHGGECRRRRDELLDAEQALEGGETGLAKAHAELASVVAELRDARATAAPLLAEAVRERLAALAMEGATFEIALEQREPGPSGADSVEFLIAPNPGVPAARLREIASGGELSRVMLALMGVAQQDGGGVLVFDEVDAGIGGHTARAVGARLRELAAGRQVLCITHLPQIASLGSRHFAIAKDSGVEPARTTVTRLAEPEVVSELVRMLGSAEGDDAARRHATELRRAA
jgi:DNA repair protein RecN (Recombination protein N)